MRSVSHHGLTLLSDVEDLRAFLQDSDVTVLSVDFFDTLVYRDCLIPEEIHARVAGSAPGRAAGLTNTWIRSRRSTEHQLVAGSPVGETTLDQIYEELSRLGVISESSSGDIRDQEILEESASWRPNKHLVQLLLDLLDADIGVTVTSDTYLPSAPIRTWMASHGLSMVEVVCSSESRKTKRSGEAFKDLRERYPQEGLLHIGDNHNSDGLIARRNGVAAAVLQGRGRFSSTMPYEAVQVAQLRSLTTYPDWVEDGLEGSLGCVSTQWAYAWSLFCATFIEQVLDYVRGHDIDTVWFVSRDCESIFECLVQSNRLVDFPRARYVYFSRVSISPLIRPLEHSEVEVQTCHTYVRQQLGSPGGESAAKLLIVDVGWKGGLQTALQSSLPNVKVHGFYVSLEPVSAERLKGRVGIMVPWDTGRFSRAMTELLFGFVGRSCVSYHEGKSGIVGPVFSQVGGDSSDTEYTETLRRFVTDLLQTNRQEAPGRRDVIESCALLMTRLQMFPRYWEVFGLSGWSVGTDSGGANSSDITGVNASWPTVLRGRVSKNNVWPAGALAFRIKSKYVAFAMQLFYAHARTTVSRARAAIFITPK